MNTNTINSHGLDIHALHGGDIALADLPARSLALDGVVRGPAEGDDLDRWSFDHHAGCVRLLTLATCEQVRLALVMGLDADDRPIYINDVDGDVLMSLWLLANPERANEPEVQALTRGVGAIDAHGPAGRVPLDGEARRLADTFFSPGGIYPFTPRDSQEKFEEWPPLIEAGLNQISEILAGRVTITEVEAPDICRVYEGVVDGVRCILVGSGGWGAFAPLYDEGFGVVIVADAMENDQGGVAARNYTLGKTSDLVPFDLAGALGRLADAEPGWGGGSSIGGAPRPDGSALSPYEVWQIVTGLDIEESRPDGVKVPW